MFLISAGLLLLLALGVATGQMQDLPRISAIIAVQDSPTNDPLFQYAGVMDLNGIAALAAANPQGMIPSIDLHAKLPGALAGWTRTDTDHAQLTWMDTIQFSMAEADYAKDGSDTTLEVVLYDSVNQASGPWTAWWIGWGFDFENSEGYARSGTFQGHPTWESRDKLENDGVLAIGLAPGTQVPELGVLGSLAAIPALMLLRRRD